jgi:spermidine/putrescine transport system ATP-binding protein
MEVQNLRKEFGDIVATDDVSFDLEEGEFVSILGPSGSGKTTILRMVGGFESPTDGSIVIDGEEITDKPSFERNVNTVFQSLALFPHLTVAENITYGLKQQQATISKEERQERVEKMLDLVDLAGYGPRDPAELSGGEQQRVALARALVNEPKILLLDEPLASLDRKLRQQMQNELSRLQEETGVTFLYVTHDQEVALSISDKMILLNQGKIEQMGDVEELYDEPRTKFVADFLGDINVIPSSIEDIRDERLALKMNGTTVDFDVSEYEGDDKFGSTDAIDICVRPHHLDIASHPPREDGHLSLEGDIRSRVFKGESFTYHLETSVGTIVVSDIKERFEEDQQVHVYWPENDTYLFPSDGNMGVS